MTRDGAVASRTLGGTRSYGGRTAGRGLELIGMRVVVATILIKALFYVAAGHA
jgi:hypothetical protein